MASTPYLDTGPTLPIHPPDQPFALGGPARAYEDAFQQFDYHIQLSTGFSLPSYAVYYSRLFFAVVTELGYYGFTRDLTIHTPTLTLEKQTADWIWEEYLGFVFSYWGKRKRAGSRGILKDAVRQRELDREELAARMEETRRQQAVRKASLAEAATEPEESPLSEDDQADIVCAMGGVAVDTFKEDMDEIDSVFQLL